MVSQKIIDSPIGKLLISATESELNSIDYLDESPVIGDSESNSLIETVEKQLNEYFAGVRKTFDIPIKLEGSEFQIKAWTALQEVPYGQTVSYQEEASKINRISAVRAVANANNKNPIPIIIPCHRVIGKNGSMTGYAGGIWRKEWLLKHEHDNPNN